MPPSTPLRRALMAWAAGLYLSTGAVVHSSQYEVSAQTTYRAVVYALTVPVWPMTFVANLHEAALDYRTGGRRE